MMVLLCAYFFLNGLFAQVTTSEMAYTGVYKGEPLFVQNPFSTSTRNYCITDIYVNKRRLDMNYNRSALMITFEQFDKYTPVSIQIKYADSTCVPILLNPNAIAYHSVFSFESMAISDSSIVWTSRGEHADGQYEVEYFNLGFWESIETISSKGVYGGTLYEYFPTYQEGTNKYRIKYVEGELVLYSHEVEHVYYPEPIEIKRKDQLVLLSRSSEYVVYNELNEEVLMGQGKQIDLTELPAGEYLIVLSDDQSELIRKNDPVKIIRRKPRSDN